DGIGSAPFSAVTLPPLEPESLSYKDMVIAESRKQFASTRGDVEAAINAWHEEGRVVQDSSRKGEGQKPRNDRPQARPQNDRATAPAPERDRPRPAPLAPERPRERLKADEAIEPEPRVEPAPKAQPAPV